MTNYEKWEQNLIGNLSNEQRDIIKENLKHCKTENIFFIIRMAVPGNGKM